MVQLESSTPTYENVTEVQHGGGDCCDSFFMTCFSSWRLYCTKQLVAAATSVILYLMILLVNSGIILYENTVADTYRHLINKVVVLMSGYNVLLVTCILPVILARQFCAHPAVPYCSVHLFFALPLTLQIFFVHNELAVLLLWSTCQVGRVQAINEDVGKVVIVVVNLVLSFFFSSVLYMSFGREGFFMYTVCTGSCPGDGDNDQFGMGNKIIMAILIVTIMNHLAMGFRMLFYQRQIVPGGGQPHQVQAVQHQHVGKRSGRANFIHHHHHSGNIVSSSLVDYKTTARTLGLTCTLGTFIVVPMYFWSGLADMVRFGVLSYALLFLPASMYIGKKHLRVTVWREVKSMCRC